MTVFLFLRWRCFGIGGQVVAELRFSVHQLSEDDTDVRFDLQMVRSDAPPPPPSKEEPRLALRLSHLAMPLFPCLCLQLQPVQQHQRQSVQRHQAHRGGASLHTRVTHGQAALLWFSG